MKTLENIKLCWQRLAERDSRKATFNPLLDWLILCLLIALVIIISLSVILYLKLAIIDRQFSDNITGGSERIDQKKLDLILVDHDKRIKENKELQNTWPTVIDPGR